MKAAYAYQIINFLVSLITMYLLLSYLGIEEYVLWSIFVTFIGVTVQLENAIQMVSVREIARGYHDRYATSFNVALKKARNAYTTLAVFVAIVIFFAGYLYISVITQISQPAEYLFAWLVLLLAYTINYFFSINNSILLASQRVSFFNNTLSFTRVLNLVFVFLLLSTGWSLLGMGVSLLIAVAVGCTLIAREATQVKSKVKSKKQLEPSVGTEIPGQETEKRNFFIPYTVFTIFAYLLYKGGVLLIAGLFDKSLVASYALSLQIFTIITTFSLVPIQIWLSDLVQAIKRDQSDRVLAELIKTFVAVNILFIIATSMLVLLGNFILSYVDTEVQISDSLTLLAMGVAFWVELNIILCVNFLITIRNYRFVKVYAISATVNLAVAVFLVITTRQLVVSLLVVPSIMQVIFCLTFIFGLVRKQLGVSLKEIAAELPFVLKQIILLQKTAKD